MEPLNFSGAIAGRETPNAKFKIGDKVKIVKFSLTKFVGKEFEITGSNWVEDDVFEYSLKGFPYLVWGDEIQIVGKEN